MASDPTMPSAGRAVPVDVVLLVPGLDVGRPGEALERLVEGLQSHLEKATDRFSAYRIATRQGEGVGQATLDLLSTDGSARRLEIRELAWTDLRPSLKDAGVLTRLLSGARLVSYWGIVMLFRSVPRASRSIRAWLVATSLSLFLWYCLILLAAYHLVAPGVQAAFGHAAPSGAQAASSVPGLLGALSNPAVLWGAIVTILGFKSLSKSIDLSWSSYAFMVDREAMRRKLRLRLRGMLSQVTIDGVAYRRIVVVAHSFGTAVAADALGAEDRVDLPIPDLDLITLGSPLEFLACRDPAITGVVERCLATKAVRAWSDFYALEDAFCSRVPLPEKTQKFRETRVKLEFKAIDLMLGRAHNAYFEHAEVLDSIIG